MFTEAMYNVRIKIMALSQIDQICEKVKSAPSRYRKDTAEYMNAMHYLIDNMDEKRLNKIVTTVRTGYQEMGSDDDCMVAESLLMITLADYQNYLGEENVYDMGWDRLVEDFFLTATA